MQSVTSLFFIVMLSLTVVAMCVFFVVMVTKRRPLTSASFVIADKHQQCAHIIGYERIIPEDGDSFDIYKQFIYHFDTDKFELLAKQRGTGIDLKSEFVTRNLANYITQNHIQLEFGKHATENGFTFLHPKTSNDPVFEIYHEDIRRSDTELPPQYTANALIFTRYTEHGVGKVSLVMRKNGRNVLEYALNGAPDADCKGFCDNQRKRLYLFYLRSRFITVGTGLCVIDYAEGKLLSDEFVR